MSHRFGNLVVLAIAVAAIGHAVSTTSQAVSTSIPECSVCCDVDHSALLALPSVQPANLTFEVPAYSVLMLGSMDFSAQRHVVRISAEPPEGTVDVTENSVAVQHIHWNDIPDNRRQLCESFTSLSRTTAFPVKFTERRNGSRSRRFEVPCFSLGEILNRHVIGHEVGCGSSVCVFSDDVSPTSQRIARRIVTLVESGLKDFVEREVGLIADIDGDGQLAIMLTSLTDETCQTGSSEPISGCVRASDFLQSAGDFSGDIIYVDPAIVERQIDAILAHELAHAATFSVMRDQLQNSVNSVRMPCWLNEAIAHYVERRVCPDTENMRRRLLSFYEEPHRYPVVIPDDSASPELKRGPARAAGCLFLEAVFNRFQTDDTTELIWNANRNCAGLEAVTGHQVEELLRLWGAELIRYHAEIPMCHIEPDQSISMDVCGTAFRWIAATPQARQITITADDDCRLQATVIHLDR